VLGAVALFVNPARLAAQEAAAEDPAPMADVAPGVVGDSARDLGFSPVPRCRLIDTRVEGGRLTVGVPRHFDVSGPLAGQGGAADCLVPLGATVAIIKLTAVQPDGAGDLQVWPFGGTSDAGNTLRFRAGARGLQVPPPEMLLPICNPAVTSCTHDLTVQANGSQTDLVADVTGYFAAIPVPWSAVTGKPAGFADNVDNDTLYSAQVGGGLLQSGTQFSIAGGGVNSARILDETIVNGDVSLTAAIAPAKIAGTAATLSFTGTQAFDTNTLVISAANNTIGIGTTTPLSPLTVATSTEPLAASAQIGHGSTRGLVLKRTSNDTGYTNLTLLKGRGDVLTPALAGDGVGQILFDVVDGTPAVRAGAEVRVDVPVLTPTDLETTMSFEVHDGAPNQPSTERLRITPAGISVTGAVSASTVSTTGSVTVGNNLVAEGDVRATGGVWVGGIASGTASSGGSLAGATFSTGCSSFNRGELRLLEQPVAGGTTDWFCVCMKITTTDHEWTCMRP
jgi:hypothetical protein